MRVTHPELERAFHRDPRLGYEPSESCGMLRYLEHGYPTPLVRWHCHDEYELHLIEATSGRAFVGNYIGHFHPGHLVLTGPRLPHNWISMDAPAEGVPLRDRVIQFAHEPFEAAAEQVPELREVLPLLERARFGVEFFGVEDASQRFQRIKAAHGLARFGEFCQFMGELAKCRDFRLMSTVQLQLVESDDLSPVNEVIAYVTEHYREPLSIAAMCERFNLAESSFSRYFRRATGNTFIDFVNRLRVDRACQLLMETDRYVGAVCYEVGFSNVANFNRRFLQIKGMTPSEFRRQARFRFGRQSLEAGAAAN